MLTPEQEAALTAKLTALQQRTGRQLVVATVPDLGGEDVQSYGYQLGRAWRVGLKTVDNGAIFLIAPRGVPGQRKVGVEVGYGLEGVLTDAYSSVIVNSVVLPRFRDNDLYGGIDAGADALIDILQSPDPEARAKERAAIDAWNKANRQRRGGGDERVPWALLIWMGVLGIVILGKVGRNRAMGRSYGDGALPIVMWSAQIAGEIARSRGGGDGDWGGWGGGGGGGASDGGGGWTDGGFTGGGGGSFGGGGASGSW